MSTRRRSSLTRWLSRNRDTIPSRISLEDELQYLDFQLNQIKLTGLKKHLRAKTIYIRTMNRVWPNNVREDGAPVGIEGIFETGHRLTFSDVWRQFIPRSGTMYGKSRFSPGKLKTWLTELEVVPAEVTCNWRLKDLLRRQVQVTVEQLCHRDESSTEKMSLHRGKFEFVEAFWIR